MYRSFALASLAFACALHAVPLNAQEAVSAHEVQRACANPEIDELDSEVHQRVCGLTIPGDPQRPGAWTGWTQVGALKLGDRIRALAEWPSGAVKILPVWREMVADPAAAPLRAEVYDALRVQRPAEFTAAFGTLDEAGWTAIASGVRLQDPAQFLRAIPIEVRPRLPWGDGKGEAMLPDGRVDEAGVEQQAIRVPQVRLNLARGIARGENVAALPQEAEFRFATPLLRELTVDEFRARVRLAPEQDRALVAIAEGFAGGGVVSQLSAAVPVSQQAALLWGVTDYVSGRAEQQFQTYFLRRFSAALCGDYQSLLPSSCGVLNGASLRSFSAGPGLLRQAVRRDLDSLPLALFAFALTRDSAALRVRNLLDDAHVAAAGVRLVREALRGEDPFVALARVAESELVKPVVQRAPVAALLAQVAAIETGMLGRGRTALHLFNDATALQEQVRWLLLAYAVNHPVSWSHLEFRPEQAYTVVSVVHETALEVHGLREAFQQARQTRPDTSAVVREAQRRFLTGTVRLADGVLERIAQVPALQSAAGFRARLGPVRAVALALGEADYSSAVLALAELVEPYSEVLQKSLRLEDMRLFSFAAEVAHAGSPAAVTASLSQFVGNGGDFMQKRSARGARVSVNTYLGLFAGGFGGAGPGWGETPDTGAVAKFAGPYLPIGVEVTAPVAHIRGLSNLGRVGVYGQLLDLGVLASWRLDGDDDEGADKSGVEVGDDPQVGLAQVFAPGLFLVWNVPETPLTVGYGVSLAPRLRSLSGSGVDEEQKVSVTRSGLFIAFDVPLFP